MACFQCFVEIAIDFGFPNLRIDRFSISSLPKRRRIQAYSQETSALVGCRHPTSGIRKNEWHLLLATC
jgi:hypothetical protein